jgi:predicted enzyme related to lactoylglutathione lyase
VTTRDSAPIGAPCWVDLTSSDPARARDFYCSLFGWGAEDPNPDFGGYFNFTQQGTRVAGGMASQPGSPVHDVWSVYLATDDAAKTVDAAVASGGQAIVTPMPVGDLGTMAVVLDSSGAGIGMWQPGQHPGFVRVYEPGAPSWFELYTRDYRGAVAFYRQVFRWDTQEASDTPEFRYTTLSHGEEQLAGIMDASSFLPEGSPAQWMVYFGVEDTDAALATVTKLGGTVVRPAEDTPYGRLAEVRDPLGAGFKLIAANQ